MSENEIIETEVVEDEGPEDIPGLDPALESERESEFTAAVKALDARGQRVVGNLLAGASVTGAADKLNAGDVAVLSGGSITRKKVSDDSAVTVQTGGAMRAALRLAGIDEAHLATVMKEGLAARKKVKTAKRTKSVPDYAIRIRYLELAHRLRGDLVKDVAAAETSYEERIVAVMRARESE